MQSGSLPTRSAEETSGSLQRRSEALLFELLEELARVEQRDEVEEHPAGVVENAAEHVDGPVRVVDYKGEHGLQGERGGHTRSTSSFCESKSRSR